VYACGYFQRTFSSTLCCWLLGKYLQPRLLIYRGINFDVPGLGVLYVRTYLLYHHMTGSRGVLLNAWRAHNPLYYQHTYIYMERRRPQIERLTALITEWRLRVTPKTCFQQRKSKLTPPMLANCKILITHHTHRPIPFYCKHGEVSICATPLFSRISDEHFDCKAFDFNII